MQSTVYDSRKQRFFIEKRKQLSYHKEKRKNVRQDKKTGERKKEKKV